MDPCIAQTPFKNTRCLQGLAFECGTLGNVLDAIDLLQPFCSSQFFLERFVIKRE